MLGSALTVFNRALTYPSQLYLAVEQISSRSPAVMLTAFIMLCAFSGDDTRKTSGAVVQGFMFYQILTVSVAHDSFRVTASSCYRSSSCSRYWPSG